MTIIAIMAIIMAINDHLISGDGHNGIVMAIIWPSYGHHMAIMIAMAIMMAIAIMMVVIVAIMAIMAINGYDLFLASPFHTKCEKCQNN